METRIDYDVGPVNDSSTRDILQRIRNFIRDFPLFNGDWKFFEITFERGEDSKKIPHGLTFIPKDVIQTAIINGTDDAAAVIWNYSYFDETYLDVTVSSACTVRAFIGRYQIRGNT